MIADSTVTKCYIKAIRKPVLCVLLVVVLTISLSMNTLSAHTQTVSDSIKLYDFSWTNFPLKILVDMNEWSNPTYSLAVREALDSWVRSISNYTQTYTNTTLGFNYAYYVSNVNATNVCDVLVSFTQNEIERNVVGLTNLRWDPRLHDPVTPVIINITSYSATADNLFIGNVAMHEFGHALGLGHANSQNTEDGPELMYPASSLQQLVYPSTLDIHGLLMLYSGGYGLTVSLPANVPYISLAEGSIIPQDQPFPDNVFHLLVNELDAIFYEPENIFNNPMRLFVPCILWILISLACGLLLSSEAGAVMGSIVLSMFICYFTKVNIGLVSLILKIVSILPAVAIGASIGGFIYRRKATRKADITSTDTTSSPQSTLQG